MDCSVKARAEVSHKPQHQAHKCKKASKTPISQHKGRASLKENMKEYIMSDLNINPATAFVVGQIAEELAKYVREMAFNLLSDEMAANGDNSEVDPFDLDDQAQEIMDALGVYLGGGRRVHQMTAPHVKAFFGRRTAPVVMPPYDEQVETAE